MSGGSLDYVCYKVDDAIDTIEKRATTVLQKAFVAARGVRNYYGKRLNRVDC